MSVWRNMKLQPNFSWQKYEGSEEDQKSQFQYQLMQQHVVVANSTNSTIDDLSFWTRERQTSYTWVNNLPIYTLSRVTVAWAGGTVNTIPLGIVGNFVIVDMVCCISDGTLSTSNTLLLPNLDVANPANEISIIRNGTSIIL